jgi:hypothetical protein
VNCRHSFASRIASHFLHNIAIAVAQQGPPSGSSAGRPIFPTTAWIVRSPRAAGIRPRSSGKASRKRPRAPAARFATDHFGQLKDDVCRFANGLKKLGVKKGDRVTIYMPMVPEAAVAMLACAGWAPHSVIFGGFSSQAIADRVEDADSELIITADGGHRRGAIVPLKANVDEALTKTTPVKKVIVLKHTGQKINWVGPRCLVVDVIAGQSADCPAEPMDAEDICSSSSTPAAPPASPRASSTPPAGTWSARISPANMSSISRIPTSTGAPPTSAGSPGTATSSTARWPTARRR